MWQFVKVKQWGYVVTNGAGIIASIFTFPIAFNSVFTAIASSYASTTGAQMGSGFVYNLNTKTCAVVHERNYGYTIIAAGK